MPGARDRQKREPFYVVEIHLADGPLVFSTRDLEVPKREPTRMEDPGAGAGATTWPSGAGD